MSEQPTEAQIKEFWEWCGWKYRTSSPQIAELGSIEYYYMTSNNTYDNRFDGYPPIDLNNLFKYATDDIVEINIMYSSACVSVDIEHKDGSFYEGHIYVDSFEEAKQKTNIALFQALWQVKEKSNE